MCYRYTCHQRPSSAVQMLDLTRVWFDDIGRQTILVLSFDYTATLRWLTTHPSVFWQKEHRMCKMSFLPIRSVPNSTYLGLTVHEFSSWIEVDTGSRCGLMLSHCAEHICSDSWMIWCVCVLQIKTLTMKKSTKWLLLWASVEDLKLCWRGSYFVFLFCNSWILLLWPFIALMLLWILVCKPCFYISWKFTLMVTLLNLE